MVSKYNSYIENQDYNPHLEVYVTKARRNTTQQERIQIVQYCLNHDKNYSEATVKIYPNAQPLFHSDRIFQFTRAPFQNQLEKNKA